MANKYSVERIDTKEFDTAIAAMNSAVKNFQKAHGRIIKITDPVMENWEGEGKKKFNKVYKRLKTELKDEETNLTNIRDNLKRIKESYEGWDKELKNSMMSSSK